MTTPFEAANEAIFELARAVRAVSGRQEKWTGTLSDKAVRAIRDWAAFANWRSVEEIQLAEELPLGEELQLAVQAGEALAALADRFGDDAIEYPEGSAERNNLSLCAARARLLSVTDLLEPSEVERALAFVEPFALSKGTDEDITRAATDEAAVAASVVIVQLAMRLVFLRRRSRELMVEAPLRWLGYLMAARGALFVGETAGGEVRVRARIVAKDGVAHLERFDGVDALGAERWVALDAGNVTPRSLVFAIARLPLR